MRRLGLLIFVLSLFAVPATANAATAGGLKQLSGAGGCLVDEATTPSGCAGVRAMQDVRDVVISPDNANVYVASNALDAIAAFSRSSSGVLTQKNSITGCITSNAATAASDTCNLVAPTTALDAVNAIAMSPDGKNVYAVMNDGTITVFNRSSDGTLSFKETNGCCTGSGAGTTITVSPDGANVYAGGPWFSGIVVQLSRDESAGNLGHLVYQTCHGAAICGAQQNLATPVALTVTPDNKELLILSSNAVLLGWDRNTTNGFLTPSATASRCVSNGTLGGTCQALPAFISAQSLVLTDGGTRINVGTQHSLVSIQRNAASNSLTPNTNGCFGYPGSGFTSCTNLPGANCCLTYFPARPLVATPDGKNLFQGTQASNPSIWEFNRSAGIPSLKPTPNRCINRDAAESCGLLREATAMQAMAASGDNRNVYAVGTNRLWSFAIDRPPVCQNVSVGTGFQSATSIGLQCSDPDGDALSYTVNQPARGRVGTPQGSAVTYDPFSNTTGGDSFTYGATAAGVQSDLATVSVNVSGPPPPGGGGTPPPSGPTLIPSTVTNRWLAFPNFTKSSNLSVNNLPAGATVRVTCKTKKKKQQKKGCPYKSKRVAVAVARAKLNLRKPFAKKRLPIGTKITVTITAPNMIGKRITYTVRKRAVPKVTTRCIPPGGKASRCV